MPGIEYRIVDGVRRTKAAKLAGCATIQAQVLDRNGVITDMLEVTIDSLRSPKDTIQRITRADEICWDRVERGARCWPLPFPPIYVQPGSHGTPIENVQFDFGGNP